MSRNRGYDSNESRRSPRDRSPVPPRYNDSRDSAQQRSASYRGTDGPSRSSVDSRANSSSFASDRDNFRESTPRQPNRDLSSTLGPPRAPKSFGDAPTGPRATTFASDTRGRGALVRGRAWHETSRDRGRDSEYDYRERREDRSVSSFRGDRGRDREWAERGDRRENIAYRVHRPSSPGSGYSRGRPRGRGDWDARGHGRGFEDRDRYRGRSRSPPSRRASVASPPPQAPVVPAFGTVPSQQSTSTAGNDSAKISPNPPVNIPTGPRLQRDPLTQPKVLALQPGRFQRSDNAQRPRTSPATAAQDPFPIPKAPSRHMVITSMVESSTPDSPIAPLSRRDLPSNPVIFHSPLPKENNFDEEDSDSESGEDMDNYFEDETKKVQDQLAQSSLPDIEWNPTYASQDAVALHPVLEPPQALGPDGDEIGELIDPDETAETEAADLDMLLEMDHEVGEETETEEEEQLTAIRRCIQTPPVSSLPFGPITPWWDDPDLLQDMEDAAQHQNFIEQDMIERNEQKEERNRELRSVYSVHYENYLRFCDSDDPAAVRYRAKITADQRARSRAASVTPAAEGRLEGRRAASRFSTEHDYARVLQESIREAQEKQERSERAAKAKAASEKEASIPDMLPSDEYGLFRFSDTSRIVPFARAVAVLGILPPVDNFADYESEIFEKTYLDFPKQWSKIAEALPGRDYKNCIQHYYIVKHRDDLKGKLKKKEKGKKRGKSSGTGGKPKSNAIMANLGSRDGEDDAADVTNGDGERRRPRRAAAPIWPIEAPSESETATPAPTPGRRTIAASKGDVSVEPGTTKRKGKGNATREKGVKQVKGGQLLAAAPSVAPKPPREDDKASPAILMTEKAQSQGAPEPPRHFSQWDGPTASPKNYPPARVSQELHTSAARGGVDDNTVHGYEQELAESAPVVATFDAQQQDRRNLAQTSSYWSVPEVNEFPVLLQHFGTDWQAIAKWMLTKTHIMVKNYYQRQVDSGKSEWEEIAHIADAHRSKGESTGLPPLSQNHPKKRYEGPGILQLRHVGPIVEAPEDKPITGQSILAQHTSPPSQSTISRFQTLAQASPVPQIHQSSQPSPIPIKPSQNLQQQQQQQPWTPQALQNRRGPPLGYFVPPDRERPIMKAATPQPPALSDPIRAQRSAQEAKIEMEQAWRLQEQAARQQKLRMKEEPVEERILNKIEQYSAPAQQHSVLAQSRSSDSVAYIDPRRVLPGKQYAPRNIQSNREIAVDSAVTSLPMAVSNPPAQITRNTVSAPPIHQEQPPPPPRPQPQKNAAARPQEPLIRKTSSIMSLLNEEPSDPRPQPKQTIDISQAATRFIASPAPQHPIYQPGRSLSGSQPAPLSRKTSLEEMHSTAHGYPRSAAPSQGPIRVVEPTWSAVAQSQPQARSQIQSPLDPTAPYQYHVQREPERREQERREQRQVERLPKVASSSSSQPIPPYHVAQHLNQRQVAFNSSSKIPASPPTQYVPPHPSRHSSFDGRHNPHGPTAPLQPPVQLHDMHYGTVGSGPAATLPYQPNHSAHHSLPPSRYTPIEPPNSTQVLPQIPQQIPQQYPSQHQSSSQPAYPPPGPPLHHHSQSTGSSRPFSPLAYEAREPFRPPHQQSQHAIDRLSSEQTQAVRQQILHQQQQQQQRHQLQHQHQHQHQLQHQHTHQQHIREEYPSEEVYQRQLEERFQGVRRG